jgi:hypothetical protein
MECFRNGITLPQTRGIVIERAFHLYGFRSESSPERWLEPLQVLDILVRVSLADNQSSFSESYLIDYARETLG